MGGGTEGENWGGGGIAAREPPERARPLRTCAWVLCLKTQAFTSPSNWECACRGSWLSGRHHSISSVYGLMPLSVVVHAGAVGSDRGRGYFEEARGS